jgi:RimJ/RimL family protein N-acetyltransferase
MTSDIHLPIRGGFLRCMVETDVHQAYVDGLNDPIVNRFMEVRHSAQTLQTVRSFIIENCLSPSSIFFGLWRHGNANHIGTIRLHNINHRYGTADIGVCLFDRRYWGRGLGGAAIETMTRWAIDRYGLRWIEAGIYDANVASQRAFVSAGYVWKFDILGKYLLEGAPAIVKVFAAQR